MSDGLPHGTDESEGTPVASPAAEAAGGAAGVLRMPSVWEPLRSDTLAVGVRSSSSSERSAAAAAVSPSPAYDPDMASRSETESAPRRRHTDMTREGEDLPRPQGTPTRPPDVRPTADVRTQESSTRLPPGRSVDEYLCVPAPPAGADGGYCRDDRLFVGTVDDEYLCSIGHGVLVNPQMAPCQHEFCKTCITKALTLKQECPMCRRPLAQEDLVTARKTSKQVLKLSVYCDNRHAGCDWQDKWGELKAHRKDCQYEPMRCPYLGCQQNVPRRHLQQHMEECDFRSVECKYCGQQVPICDTDHASECPKMPVVCPQKCSDPGITRESVDEHIRNHCPFTLVPCPFARYGCDAGEMQRVRLAEHMEKAVAQHTLLLCNTVHEQSQVIEKQQQTIRRLLRRSLIVVDQSGKGTFRTLTEAIDNAEPGDRIVVRKGTYRECLVISKHVRIEVEEVGDVVIENGGDSNVLVLREACHLYGLTLRQRSRNFFCIRILRPEDPSQDEEAVVETCDVQSDHFSCIQIDSGANPLIKNCKIHDSRQCGILVKRNGAGRIENNEISGNCLSNVYIDAHANPSVFRNQIRDSQQHGIWIKQHGAGIIANNTIHDNLMSPIKTEEGANPECRRNIFTP